MVVYGSDMHVLQEMACITNVVGINDHEWTELPTITASMVLLTNQGPIVGIIHEYAHFCLKGAQSCLWSTQMVSYSGQ